MKEFSIIWSLLGAPKRLLCILTLFLAVAVSFAELVTIGSIVPVVMALTDSQGLAGLPDVILLGAERLGVDLNINSRVIIFGFISVLLVSSGLRLLLLYSQTIIAHSIGAEIGKTLFAKTLDQEIDELSSKNSSDLIAAVAQKSNVVVYNVILPFLLLLSSITVLVIVFLTIFTFSAKVAAGIITFVVSLYALIAFPIRILLKRNGIALDKYASRVVNSVQNAFGAIREIILYGLGDTLNREYADSDSKMRKAQALNQFLGGSPKVIVEFFSMATLLLLALSFSRESYQPQEWLIPLLAATAFGAQRMLPVAQQVYLSWSQITGGGAVLKSVTDLLVNVSTERRSYDKTHQICLNQTLKVVDGSIGYGGSEILKDINIEIAKGSWVGILGPSGSGKSSLANVIIGLKNLKTGQLVVDDLPISVANRTDWMRNIALVPQEIYLLDDTLRQNIRFGTHGDKKYSAEDEVEVDSAVEISQLAEFIESLPLGLETRVGENGSMLSGGQKQRVGMARGLYIDRPLIVLDEATSSLDLETEARVLNALKRSSQSYTILMIAHRIETLKFCDTFLVAADNTVREVSNLKECLAYVKKQRESE